LIGSDGRIPRGSAGCALDGAADPHTSATSSPVSFQAVGAMGGRPRELRVDRAHDHVDADVVVTHFLHQRFAEGDESRLDAVRGAARE
jgi:hypothetical protein